ncbi:hypothetical protein [Methanobacterium alcaliphilum]|uniref:hypothetical protein n=1 Tax=Methanobacterium alcaliphilum TaxID=392018 RepID=UPI00200B7D87|nr:hypothetical protein [Methanobacterium alcaliphilum]MCK9151001.1 hypothetical protein [Methanobacterium alcaliphilum]
MDLKTTIGVCKNVDYEEKKVIIPKDPDLLEDNDVVLIISAKEFSKLADNVKDLIKYVETVQELREL